MGFPPLPSPLLALSTLLRVPASSLFQGLRGYRKRGPPGKDLGYLEHKLLFLFQPRVTVLKRCTAYPSTTLQLNSFIGCPSPIPPPPPLSLLPFLVFLSVLVIIVFKFKVLFRFSRSHIYLLLPTKFPFNSTNPR